MENMESMTELSEHTFEAEVLRADLGLVPWRAADQRVGGLGITEGFEVLARRRRCRNSTGSGNFAAMKRPKPMIIRIVVGAVVGGGLGFAYYKFVGCSTGTCPLTSNPFISTLYGMTVGALVAGSFH
jgi:hypothetical protein